MKRVVVAAALADGVLSVPTAANADPVEYVRVCGTHSFYIPGTDVCADANTGHTTKRDRGRRRRGRDADRAGCARRPGRRRDRLGAAGAPWSTRASISAFPAMSRRTTVKAQSALAAPSGSTTTSPSMPVPAWASTDHTVGGRAASTSPGKISVRERPAVAPSAAAGRCHLRFKPANCRSGYGCPRTPGNP